MAASTRAIQAFLDRMEAFQRAIAGTADADSLAAGRAVDALTKELFRLVGTESMPSGAAIRSEQQVQAVVRQAEGIIAEALRAMEGRARKAFAAQFSTMANELPGVYAAFGRTTADRLLGARNAFKAQARGELFQRGFDDWMRYFRDIDSILVDDMAASVTDAMKLGWDQRQLALDLLSKGSFQYENLPALTDRGVNLFSAGGRLGHNEALIRRAHLNARTKLTAARNSANARWANEVGYTSFLNVNLTPVSVQCRSANAQGVMTEAEWREWGAWNGWAWRGPRHPGCDSDLVAVPGSQAPAVSSAAMRRRADLVDAIGTTAAASPSVGARDS